MTHIGVDHPEGRMGEGPISHCAGSLFRIPISMEVPSDMIPDLRPDKPVDGLHGKAAVADHF